MHDSGDYLFCAVSAGIFVGIIVLVIFLITVSRNKMRERLRAAAMRIGGAIDEGSWRRLPSLTGTVGKHQVMVHFHVVSTGQASVTYIRHDVMTPQNFDLTITKEGILHKVGKSLNLSHEITTGDDAFDSAFFLKTAPQDEPSAGAYLSAPVKRSRIISLTDGMVGFANLTFSREVGIRLEKIYQRKDLNEETLLGRLRALSELAD